MPESFNPSFHNILLTLKRYRDRHYEVLYISSEIREIIREGEKFYQESFFINMLPALDKPVFEFLFRLLGNGDKLITPMVLGEERFQLVQIEGYVIAQEDESYLVNVLISPVAWSSDTKFSILVNRNEDKIFLGLSLGVKFSNVGQWLAYFYQKFSFLKSGTLEAFYEKEEQEVLEIFPSHLYLTKKFLSSEFVLIQLDYGIHKESLYALEQGKRTALEHAENLIYYEYTASDGKLSLSGKLKEILGFPTAYFHHFSVKDWKKLIHPEDRHLYEMRFEHNNKLVYKVLTFSGQYIFVQDETKQFDQIGSKGMILGIISDVTGLKEIEKDLMHHKTVLDELTGVVPGMVYLLKANPDHSHTFLFVSEGCKQLTELTPQQILESETHLGNLVHPEDNEGLIKADREAYLNDRKFEHLFRITTPSGKTKWLFGASNRLKQYKKESIWAGFFVDFTYTKEKEAESLLNLKRYKSLFDENPLPIFQYNRLGIIKDANKSFLNKLGIQGLSNLIGHNFLELFDEQPAAKCLEECISQSYGYFEGPFLSKFNNQLFHIRITAKPIDDGQNFQAIIEDISEQEYVHNILSHLTEKTSKFSGNKFFEELTAYLSASLHMEICYIAEVDREFKQATIISQCRNGKNDKSKLVFNLKNTAALSCLQSGVPLMLTKEAFSSFDKDPQLVAGQITSFLGVPISDVENDRWAILVLMDSKPQPLGTGICDLLKVLADRIGAELNRLFYENKLLSSELLFRSIAENFPKGTIEVLDKKLIYVYTDGKEYQAMGIDPKKLIGTPHLSKYENYVSKKVRAYLDKVLQGESVMFEVINGNQYYLKSGVPLVNKEGEIDSILLVTQNITETKLAEEEREQLIRDLKSQNEELQRFAYIVSHNLRAPIVNISSLLDLYDTENPLDQENPEIIENLKYSTDILNGTLKDLIEVVAIKKNKLPKVEQVEFMNLINNIERSLFQQIRASNAVIEKDFAQAPYINYIYSHLENFLINLTTNSIKYRHPERNPEIHIRTYPEGEYTIIEFTDNGIGLDLERYGDRLFGLYQRFHSHVEGKGLGLYLVREQIRAHDGNLRVESKLGEGTTFWIHLKNMKFGAIEDVINKSF
jgi:signal transduction histidine kinase